MREPDVTLGNRRFSLTNLNGGVALMRDRRRSERFGYRIKISWKDAQFTFDSITRDICVDGAFICTDRIIPSNSLIEMELLFVDGTAPVRCRGRVAWVNRGQLESYPPGFGVEFIGVDKGILQRLIDAYEVEDEDSEQP